MYEGNAVKPKVAWCCVTFHVDEKLIVPPRSKSAPRAIETMKRSSLLFAREQVLLTLFAPRR